MKGTFISIKCDFHAKGRCEENYCLFEFRFPKNCIVTLSDIFFRLDLYGGSGDLSRIGNILFFH